MLPAQNGTFMQNAEVSRKIASRLPYKDMLQASLRKLKDMGESNFLTDATMDAPTMLRLQVRMHRPLCVRVCAHGV